MRKFRTIFAALIAVLVLSVAVFATSPPASKTNPFIPSAEMASVASQEAIVSTGDFKIAPDFEATDQAPGATITAYRDHVYTTGSVGVESNTTFAGKLIEKISVGLAAANPFYIVKVAYGIKASEIRERGTLFNLKEPVRLAPGLIYDLPPNLRLCKCSINYKSDFKSTEFAYRFRMDRARFV